MDENLLGVENIKEGIETVCELATAIDQAVSPDSQNGEKITIGEGIVISKDAIMAVLSFAKKWKAIKAEKAELTADERAELTFFFEEKFDLENDVAEKLVESALSVLFNLGSLIQIQKEVK